MKKLTNEQRAKRILLVNAIRNWTLAAVFAVPTGALVGVQVHANMEARKMLRDTQVEVIQMAQPTAADQIELN